MPTTDRVTCPNCGVLLHAAVELITTTKALRKPRRTGPPARVLVRDALRGLQLTAQEIADKTALPADDVRRALRNTTTATGKSEFVITTHGYPPQTPHVWGLVIDQRLSDLEDGDDG